MDYRNRLQVIIYCFTFIFLFTACEQKEEAIKKPNIILIMCDDLGWGDTGFNGNEIIKTPNLDMLAGKGIVFNRFYSASAVCSPTRGSCLTGRNPYRGDILEENQYEPTMVSWTQKHHCNSTREPEQPREE